MKQKPCPHSVMQHSWENGISATVARYRVGAKECSACDFLLKVVEEYLPGWIDGEENGDDLQDRSLRVIELCFSVTHKFWSPPLVILRQVPLIKNASQTWSEEDELPDGWDKNAQNIGSFCCFRTPPDGASFTDIDSSIFDSRIVLRESLDIAQDSSSAIAFERVSSWLSHCLQNDNECRIPNPNYMPRRVLNVGSVQGPDPFLCEPKKAEPYVCLSYCWGTDLHDVLKSTKENLKYHYDSIPLAAFPKTIRDAVVVCRALNIQYLWVDSFCVIQDDPGDWLQDAAQMRDIFANSHLTIAAQEPASCKEGFLGAQTFGKAEWQRKLVTPVPSMIGGPRNEVFIRPTNVSKEPLERYSTDKRAWCLQENILPNRVLSYNGEEMSWSCVCRRICECGHKSWNHPTDKQLHYHEIASKLKRGYNSTTPNAPYENWMVIVEDYSNRILTKEMDKLTALSGLATMICDTPMTAKTYTNLQERKEVFTTVENYVAGLWKNHFIQDLTWRAVKPKPVEAKLQTYRAPSWSWACIDGPILYDYHRRIRSYKMSPTPNPKPTVKMDCTVDRIECKNALSSDPTSGVLAANATLTGPLVEVELVTLDFNLSQQLCRPEEGLLRYPKSLVRPESLKSFHVSLDYIQPPFLESGNPQAECWTRGICQQKGCSCNQTFMAGSRYYCLSLFSAMSNPEGSETQVRPESFFLLLRKSEDTKGRFERIGMGSANSAGFELFAEATNSVVTVI